MLVVNIPDDVLADAMRDTPGASSDEVVTRALKEFASNHGQKQVVKHLGTFEDFMIPEELNDMREMD